MFINIIHYTNHVQSFLFVINLCHLLYRYRSFDNLCFGKVMKTISVLVNDVNIVIRQWFLLQNVATSQQFCKTKYQKRICTVNTLRITHIYGNVDINECKTDAENDCYSRRFCTNTRGGYTCSCPRGLRLKADGVTCEGDSRHDAAVRNTSNAICL